jgi:phosphatidylinositol kinase/protein kinase (PI-3  family)
MRNLHIKPYLLTSFFHRIFYSVDELFIFKKYFTTYHATNSFFSYAFNQADVFTLQQLSVNKQSGCVSFNDAKLIEFLRGKNIKGYILQAQQKQTEMDFESLESEDRQSLSYLPFRLSGNLVDFIGKIGLHGVFAGVLSACSLAIGRHHEKLMPLLNIIYRDEVNPWPSISMNFRRADDDRDNTFYFIGICVDYIKFKMLSLS